MRVVLVEDNRREAEELERELAEGFRCNVSTIRTELEFCDRLDELQRNPPDLFIIDVILRWTTPGPGFRAEPDEVRKGGREMGGFRCVERLQDRLSTRGIPIVLYSHFQRFNFEKELQGMPKTVAYAEKRSDPRLLFQTIRTLVGA